MRLTRFTDNALRCLLHLGGEPTRIATVHEIATAMGMSHDNLLKVIKRLVDLGWVRTIRGRHGGVQLAVQPHDIRVADVIRATEDNLALAPCFGALSDSCPVGPVCQLATCLHEALGAFFAVLAQYSIADLVRQRRNRAA